MATKNRVRLSLDLSHEMNATLERLAEQTDGTKSNVLRMAIVLLDVAVEAKLAGKKFGIAETNQVLETEIVGL